MRSIPGRRVRAAMILLLLTIVAAPASAGPRPPERKLDLPPAEARPDDLPYGAATSYMMARMMLDQGDRAGALPYLAHAYRLMPDHPGIGNDFLDALLQEGYVEEALDVNRALVRRLPRDFELNERLVVLLTGMRRFDEAGRTLAEVMTAFPDSTQLLLLSGEIAARAGDTDAALERYREALSARPQERESIYVTLAQLLRRAERPDSLLALWDEALAELPESAPLRVGSLRDRISLERLDEATDVAAAGDSLGVQTGADTPEDGPHPWTEILAELLIQGGHPQRALGILQELSESDAISLPGNILLGRLLARENRMDKAIVHLRGVVAGNPGSGLARMYLGEFLADSGDLSGGEAELRRAAELEPENPDILLALITLLATRYPDTMLPKALSDDQQPVREEIGSLAETASGLVGYDSPRSSMLLGIALHGAGKLDLAAKHYAAAGADDGLRREAFLNLSLVEDELDHPDRVLDVLEHLLKEYPEDAVVQNALGYSLAEQGVQLGRAERLIRKALEQDPENPAFLDSLGWVLYRRDDFAGALDLLVDAANTLPDDPVILEHLGFTLRALGRLEAALRTFQRAVLAGSTNPEIPDRIREIQAEVGE